DDEYSAGRRRRHRDTPHRRHRRTQGRVLTRVGGADAHRHRDRLPGCRVPTRWRRRARTRALLRRDPSRADERLRGPGHPPVGAGDLRERPGAGVRDSRARFRHPVPGCEEPTVAPRLPVPAGDIRGPPTHVAGLQPDRRGHRPGDGSVRDRARHTLGAGHRVRPRHVPRPGAVAALPGPRRRQAALHGRHLHTLRADDPPRHGEPVRPVPAGAGAGSGRAGRRALRAARHGRHHRVPREPARGCARASVRARRRPARADRAEARHRGPGDGRAV
ncbi:MAG: FIG01134926: hypothetical protein, partial [uncultured Nocardioidaceae bacterium]